jgi:hypothetical protein
MKEDLLQEMRELQLNRGYPHFWHVVAVTAAKPHVFTSFPKNAYLKGHDHYSPLSPPFQVLYLKRNFMLKPL